MRVSLLDRALNILGRMTKAFIPRPRNLLIIPHQMELSALECVAVYGVDAYEIISGCGGLLAQHHARGGKSILFLRSPAIERDLEALAELGLDKESIHEWSDESRQKVPEDVVFFYPFPPGRSEVEMMKAMDNKHRLRSYFYESRFLMLPDNELRIDEVYDAKLRAMAVLKPEKDPQFSHVLAIYRSAATGKGAGWYESYLSFGVADSVISHNTRLGDVYDGSCIP